jgi:hypothetical protein
LKVAVIGLGKTHDQAPWDDPAWQKWGLPWDEGYWQRLDRLFEMHDKRLLESEHSRRKPGYLDRLEGAYTQGNYPFDAVAESIGAYYWNSSIAYAMALAIHEGAEEIGVWGVDLVADDEYSYQRPNMEYLIGLARGRGIKVYIPPESALCKFNGAGIRFYKHLPIYVDRYGWLGD